MARIRTIKPEFWDSPSTAKAGPWARLLYLAMWNWADDWGIGDASASRLRAFAFPNDEVSVTDYPRLVAEIHSAYGVVFFEHQGRRFYAIPTFDKHQRTEKRAKPREDLIEAARIACNGGEYQPSLPDDSALVTDSPNLSADSPRGEVGTGEQGKGNRGTGEVVRASARDTDDPLPPKFDEFCKAWPGDIQTKPAFAAWVAAVKRAKGKPDRIIQGAHDYADSLTAKGTESKFIRNVVKWLNEDGWLDNLKPISRAAPKSTTDERFMDAMSLAQQLEAEEARAHAHTKAIEA